MFLTALAHAQGTGLASYYGNEFNGRLAASGEVFDQQKFTAAHRTLPFGTLVRVRRLDTAESIVVRINDRGPFVASRIIDLSYAAARTLGMTAPGVVPVALQIIDMEPPDEAEAGEVVPRTPRLPEVLLSYFAVQAAIFRSEEDARRLRNQMEEKYGNALMMASRDGWRVMVGRVSTESEAESLAGILKRSDKSYATAVVVRMDGGMTGVE
jgi:rare lipoprotein A